MMYFEHDKKWQTVWGLRMKINPLTAMITINAAIICCDVYVNVVDVVLVLMVFVLFAGQVFTYTLFLSKSSTAL